MTMCKFTITGMNNVLDPALLPYEVRGGFVQSFVSEVTNCDVKTPFGVKKRTGYTQVENGAFSSGWSDGEIAYVVSNGVLYSFDGDTLTALKVLTTNDRASFVKVNDVVVMSNGSDYVVISNGVATDAVPSTESFKLNPPAGQLLCFYNGRLYVAAGSVLYCLDTFSVDVCDERQMIVDSYSDNITVLAQVGSGLVVGTSKEVHLLAGDDPYVGDGFSKRKLLPYGAILGTSVETEGVKVNIAGYPGRIVIFASTKGICVVTAGGEVKNLTSGMVEYKHDLQGAAYLREENGETHYVVSFPQTYSEENVYALPTFDVDEKDM